MRDILIKNFICIQYICIFFNAGSVHIKKRFILSQLFSDLNDGISVIYIRSYLHALILCHAPSPYWTVKERTYFLWRWQNEHQICLPVFIRVGWFYEESFGVIMRARYRIQLWRLSFWWICSVEGRDCVKSYV